MTFFYADGTELVLILVNGKNSESQALTINSFEISQHFSLYTSEVISGRLELVYIPI